MRIIFAGTPDIAADVLQALIDARFDVIACLTQADRPKGRGQKLTASPVKELALKHNIPILQPLSLKDPKVQQQLRDLKADLMIVLAYGMILPQAVLDIPKMGCINIHASILPRWRGAAPIVHAILAGDQETGITIMQMDAGLDTGDMLGIYPCKIAHNETGASLYAKLTEVAKRAIVDTLRQQKFNGTPQDNALATYAHKISKEQAKIDWQQSALVIDRAIRAYNPWPVAFTYLKDQLVRVWRAELCNATPDKKASAGTILGFDDQGILVATGDGVLRLIDLQFPGKKILPVLELRNSHAELKSGERFSNY